MTREGRGGLDPPILRYWRISGTAFPSGCATILMLSLCASCHPVAPMEQQDPVNGSYALVYYGPDKVPANVSELPTRPGGGPSGCYLRVTEGEILFTPSNSLFRYRYEFHNSCDGRLLSSQDIQGRYDQDGPRLTFTVIGPDGDESFPGEVRDDTVTVRWEIPSLTFAR